MQSAQSMPWKVLYNKPPDSLANKFSGGGGGGNIKNEPID